MEHTLTVGNKRQLVDLNEELVNFEVKVKVTPLEQGEFEAAFVKQTDLDSGNVDHKMYDKTFGARIINNDNLYQNHFLSLKSENPIKIKVEILRKEIPANSYESEPLPSEQEEELLEPPPPQPVVQEKQTSGFFTMKNIILLLVILGIGFGIYYMWFGGSSTGKKSCVVTEMPAKSPPNPGAEALLAKLQGMTSS